MRHVALKAHGEMACSRTNVFLVSLIFSDGKADMQVREHLLVYLLEASGVPGLHDCCQYCCIDARGQSSSAGLATELCNMYFCLLAYCDVVRPGLLMACSHTYSAKYYCNHASKEQSA